MDPQKPNEDMRSILTKIGNLAQNKAQNQSFDQYIEKLIEEKKFSDLTPEVREEIKKNLLIRLDDFIAARIIAGLSDEDVLSFEKMLKENKSEEEIQKFVSSNIDDFTGFLANVLLEFRGLYLGIINAPPKTPPAETVTPLPPAPIAE